MFKRCAQASMVCLLSVVMLGANPSSRFDRVGHEMICACGCGQVLLDCNHVGCPVSPGMIGELHTQMDDGGSDTSILNWNYSRKRLHPQTRLSQLTRKVLRPASLFLGVVSHLHLVRSDLSSYGWLRLVREFVSKLAPSMDNLV
jgi:hypothetical protein